MAADNTVPRSWGRYPEVTPGEVVPVYWRDELPDLQTYQRSVLPFAYGRSYGDSCLNQGGVSVDVSHLRRLLAFDDKTGVLRCEAGVSLAEILEVIVPRGWFLPVTPGTKFVSVGGAIANDVHGKNHHKAGTFGCHVTQFELVRSNGEHLLCTPEQNSELFCATIGGLGLTGIILWAEFRLLSINGPYIDVERIRFTSLKEFMDISADSDSDFEYTVAWIDCLENGNQSGRGMFMRGNHERSGRFAEKEPSRKLPLAVPVDMPSFVLNMLSIKAFNTAYYHAQVGKQVRKVMPYEPFFYPLDAIDGWNRMYGKRGFMQYQFVVPFAHSYAVMQEILERISHSGEGSFLTVLKKFGDVPSPGLLSFPRPGLTLALDFANNGARTLRLFTELDELVLQSGGAVYPAKDARMAPESFQRYFPQWKTFEQYIDPQFSSSFWRRVTPAHEQEEGA
ncbi:MAG TPA: FAD-binding oxidoreductase [Ktedonobacteraceae bacterium]|nr:FAD-binding oxidoreductase [Ktedonobacteraceae bacterium]